MKLSLAKMAIAAVGFSLSMVSSVWAADLFEMNYREKEASTQHLYRAVCYPMGKESTCTLKVVSIRSDKSIMSCSMSVDTLFENEPAKSDGGDNFVVSVTRGACGYTNTYVLSKTGMVQTKTSPEKIPESLKTSCQVFPPKTYQVAPNPDPLNVFADVPLGTCPTIAVNIF